MSKDFLSLLFVVGQVLSISGYDLENGRMPCKQKYWIKNMAIKIAILIVFWFCLLCWLRSVSCWLRPVLSLRPSSLCPISFSGAKYHSKSYFSKHAPNQNCINGGKHRAILRIPVEVSLLVMLLTELYLQQLGRQNVKNYSMAKMRAVLKVLQDMKS